MGRDEMFNGQLRFEYIPPIDLRDTWPRVRDGVEKVSKHTDEWIIEDVYSALLNNHSTLHIAYSDEKYMGFMVLTPITGYCATKLHVWLAYAVEEGFDVMESGIVEINELARKIKAKTITFESPRKGWGKTAEKLGYTPQATRYARKVKS